MTAPGATDAADRQPVISLRGVTRVYGEGEAAVHALRGIDLDIAPGEFGGFDRHQRSILRRDYLGFVFQGFNLLARTSALDNVELPLIYKGVARAERRALAKAMLERVGLGRRLDKEPSKLSGGEQQRVAIARAIASEPAVLLADEPTGNLDTARSQEIMELIARLNREEGLTVIMVTHEPDMAEYAGRIVHFKDGLIERDGMNGNPRAPATETADVH
jgi:putative ABC transport system ATP-binding protein